MLAFSALGSTILILQAGTFADRTFRDTMTILGVVVNSGVIVVGNVIDLWILSKSERAAASSSWFFQGPSDVSETNVELGHASEFTSATTFSVGPALGPGDDEASSASSSALGGKEPQVAVVSSVSVFDDDDAAASMAPSTT